LCLEARRDPPPAELVVVPQEVRRLNHTWHPASLVAGRWPGAITWRVASSRSHARGGVDLSSHGRLCHTRHRHPTARQIEDVAGQQRTPVEILEVEEVVRMQATTRLWRPARGLLRGGGHPYAGNHGPVEAAGRDSRVVAARVTGALATQEAAGRRFPSGR
jgi:hypothetical protein